MTMKLHHDPVILRRSTNTKHSGVKRIVQNLTCPVSYSFSNSCIVERDTMFSNSAPTPATPGGGAFLPWLLQLPPPLLLLSLLLPPQQLPLPSAPAQTTLKLRLRWLIWCTACHEITYISEKSLHQEFTESKFWCKIGLIWYKVYGISYKSHGVLNKLGIEGHFTQSLGPWPMLSLVGNAETIPLHFTPELEGLREIMGWPKIHGVLHGM